MAETPNQDNRGAGCLMLALLFGGVAVAGWVVTILLYSLVVEEWGLITVRREFGLDIAMLWAPVAGLVLGAIACFWATRGPTNAQRIPFFAGIAALVAILLFVMFAGLGTIL
jgi:hypothetical protein